MSGMMTIAVALGNMYRERAEASLQEWQINNHIAMRKLELTPPEGWPGKNAEQRETEAERVFMADEIIALDRQNLAAVKATQSTIEGEVEALEAERRALEWDIRLGLVQALGGKVNETNEEPFDTALQAAVDEAAFDNEPPTATYSMMPPAPDDEVPF